MSYFKKIILCIFVLLGGCNDINSNTADNKQFSQEEIENAMYKVYFYYSDGRSELLGTVQGLKTCRYSAQNFASSRSINNWHYECCMIGENNSCVERLR